MKCLSLFCLVLVILGALNWGLWGFFQFDFVAWIGGGNTTWLARFIYAIIGLAGLFCIRRVMKCKHLCGSTSCCSKGGKGGCCR